MNLVELEIHDYRKFAGTHTFTPGQQSMVAIIGPNGAGKTSLFEAVEWCLYNPSNIRNDDIRPRIKGGRPRVKVTLEHPHTGELFEIERELRSGSVRAAIYRSSQPDTPVVQGTRQVTDYVASQLLGLSQSAFVATFFTRQKELSFFGSMGPTDRRREVGRLLGLETIRIAQESIGRQRQDKLQEARIKLQMFEQQSADRDFAAERYVARTTIERCAAEVQEAANHLAAHATELTAAQKDLQEQQERADQSNALQLESTKLQGELKQRQDQVFAAHATLREIEAAADQLTKLEPLAADAARLASVVEQHQANQVRTNRIAELQRQLADLTRTVDGIQTSAAEIAGRLKTTITGDLAASIDHLMSTALSARSAELQAHANKLERALSLKNDAQQAAKTLQRYRERVAEIRQQITQFEQAGDPSQAVLAAEQARQATAREAAAADSTIRNLAAHRNQLDSLAQRLTSGQFDEPCPTCGRPYLPDELDRDLDALRAQVASLDRQIAEQRAIFDSATEQSAAAAKRETEARQQQQQLSDLETRLKQSEPYVQEAEESASKNDSELAALLLDLKRSESPNDAEVEAARLACEEAQRKESEAPLLQDLQSRLRVALAERETVEATLSDLGSPTYDAAQHKVDQEAWQKARDAAAQAEVFQRQIEQRPAIEARLDQAKSEMAMLESAVKAQSAAIASLAFRREDLDQARTRENNLRKAHETVLAEQHRAQSALTNAERELRDIDAFESRLQELRDTSIEAQRKADDLDRMYREFARFEQYVARTVTPAIADLTSQLVSAVTDGKYDRIEFTDDFGIEIYDGPDDPFPLSQFSGGERDVFALCARLALSQFIGSQSDAPPQFVVLDEVFGSLDKTRRENLMDTLQKLIDHTGRFRQIFVISHVDDVQASAAFDEVWQVRETSEGTSELERVTSASIPVEM